MLRKLLLAFALTFAATAPVHAQSVKEINFGIISTETSSHLKQHWQPLIEDMAARTGLKINAYFASDYAGIIEAQRFNKVQVAWYGNKAGMEAVDRSNGEVFAQMVAPDGGQGYYSLLVVHKDSPLKSVDDVLKNGKTLNFGIGDPNSTSGYLVPMYYVFALNKVDPKAIFKTVRGANHETNLLAVVNRQLDVATNNNENIERFTARFPEKAGDIRVIWKSPLIPNDPLVWRKDLPADVKSKIKTFITTYGTGPEAAREKEVLKKLTTAGFRASDNTQLVPIRQLELFKDKIRVETDQSIDPKTRQERLAEINRKLAELSTQVAAK